MKYIYIIKYVFPGEFDQLKFKDFKVQKNFFFNFFVQISQKISLPKYNFSVLIVSHSRISSAHLQAHSCCHLKWRGNDLLNLEELMNFRVRSTNNCSGIVRLWTRLYNCLSVKVTYTVPSCVSQQ